MMPQIRRTAAGGSRVDFPPAILAAGEPNGGESQTAPEKTNREDEILQAVFDGGISTPKGIAELCGTGLPLEEARSLVYRAAVLGRDRRMSKKN
jgi:hypothetical protein